MCKKRPVVVSGLNKIYKHKRRMTKKKGQERKMKENDYG